MPGLFRNVYRSEGILSLRKRARGKLRACKRCPGDERGERGCNQNKSNQVIATTVISKMIMTIKMTIIIITILIMMKIKVVINIKITKNNKIIIKIDDDEE